MKKSLQKTILGEEAKYNKVYTYSYSENGMRYVSYLYMEDGDPFRGRLGHVFDVEEVTAKEAAKQVGCRLKTVVKQMLAEAEREDEYNFRKYHPDEENE